MTPSRHKLCLAAGLGLMQALWTLASALPVSAETSEWSQRVSPEAHPVSPKAASGKKAPAAAPSQPGGKVKSHTVEPKHAPKAPLAAGSSAAQPVAALRQSLGPATAPTPDLASPAPGSDPAYEAFDQGKYLTALRLAQQAADKGDPQAHTLIGRIHADGLGVPRSPETAAKWYAKAAELGDLEGTFALGVLYAQGVGVERNYPEAARLIERVAMTGHALANYNLALIFLRGEGKPENPRRAFAHMEYAAEKGVVAAQYDLGTLYATGTGTEINAYKAARWFAKAATAGHTEAEVEYATILFKVDGPPQGDAEAQKEAYKRGAELFRRAAEKGVAIAQNRLARCYANGMGVAADPIEAAKWALIAKANGDEDAELEKQLLPKLSRTDRQKAERAALEWRERRSIE